MRSRPLVAGSAGLLGGLALLACALTDVFDPPGPAADLVFVFATDSVLAVGDTVPLLVAVRTADGDLAAPRLRVTSLEPTLLQVNSRGDTLIGLAPGRAFLDVQLVSSVLPDTPPDTVYSIRVRP